MSNQQFRQGDIFFQEVAAPKGKKKMQNNVIAYGEVTGHAHKIMDPPFSELDSVVDENGDIFVKNPKGPVTISHDEHGSITLPPNKWFKITRQREYDAISEMRERKVAD